MIGSSLAFSEAQPAAAMSTVEIVGTPVPLDNYASYWAFNEATGATREDDGSAGVDLTDNSTGGNLITQAVGRIDFAAQSDGTVVGISTFGGSAGSSQYLKTDMDFTMHGWLYLDVDMADDSYSQLFLLNNHNDGEDGATVYLDTYGAGTQLYGGIEQSSGTIPTNGATVVTGAWYFWVVQFDLSESLVSLSLSKAGTDATVQAFNTPVDTADTSWTEPQSGGDVEAGGTDGTATIRLCDVGILNRLLTEAELAWLYNEGGGNRPS